MVSTMTLPTPTSRVDPAAQPRDFSLVLGGPLFQLWRRARLSGDALQLLRLRMIVIALLCWLPLFVLCAVDGQLLDGPAAIPFLHDFEVHSRFLLALPLLIVAELIVHQRMGRVVSQFLERELVPDEEMARFDAAIAAAVRLRNSVWAELALIGAVLVVGHAAARYALLLETDTWYATPSPAGPRYSMAGVWYAYVSLPFFQFIICRWYLRVFIWWRFLWHVSRIPLRLIATHPDRAAGLSFLASVVAAFGPIATAHGALFAGRVANEIFYAGAALPQYLLDVTLLVVSLLALVLGPLLVFSPQLARVKTSGRREYDLLAQRYVREFDTKWLRGGAPKDEALLGSADLQSLADLGNGLEVVRSMRVAPITRDSAVTLALATLAPLAPLLLTMMPLEELVKRLFGVVF
jgi:hypothetical protein